MCLCMAVQANGLRLVATDTRWFLSAGNRDLGSKLVHTPTGFAVISGDAHTGLLTLRRLRLIGVQDLDAVQRALEASSAVAEANGQRHGRFTFAFTASASGIAAVYDDGRPRQQGGPRLMSYPPKMSDAVRGDIESWVTRNRNRVDTLERVVRAVASVFALASERCDQLSEYIEIGVLAGPRFQPFTVSGRAADLAKADRIHGTAPPYPGELLHWSDPLGTLSAIGV